MSEQTSGMKGQRNHHGILPTGKQGGGLPLMEEVVKSISLYLPVWALEDLELSLGIGEQVRMPVGPIDPEWRTAALPESRDVALEYEHDDLRVAEILSGVITRIIGVTIKQTPGSGTDTVPMPGGTRLSQREATSDHESGTTGFIIEVAQD
jgi:hypothetical protein